MEAGSLLTSQSERSADSKVLRPAQVTFLCCTPAEKEIKKKGVAGFVAGSLYLLHK